MSTDLLRRIEEFAIDGTEPPALPFAARLARENGWTRARADRAVREYKRFVYLAVTAGHPVCPSEDVDEAWHLHLTYTRSYWKRFCGEVLGRPLHHDPTRGGPAEADKHHRMYEQTLKAYRQAFGADPPADVWPPAAERFADPARHVRVDRAENWVVPKKGLRRVTAAAGLTAAALVFATGCTGNPFDLEGSDFLLFLFPVMLAALVVGLAIRKWMRAGAGSDGPDLEPDWQHAAYLVGQKNRLLTAAIARLVNSGVARVSFDGRAIEAKVSDPPGLTPVERAVYGSLPLQRDNPGELVQMIRRADAAFAPELDRLRAAGLAFDPGYAARVALASAAPLAATVVFLAVPRLVLGVAGGKPVGYLIAFLVLASLTSLGMALARPFRTPRGDRAVADMRAEHAALKQGKTWEPGADAALAVALFGTAALVGTDYALLSDWFPRMVNGSGADGSGGGSGCSSGDGGGGGGCGSGCGGCGGGD